MQRPGVVYLHLLPSPASPRVGSRLPFPASGGPQADSLLATAAPPAPQIMATLGLLVLPPAAASEVQAVYGRMVEEAAEAAADAAAAAGGQSAAAQSLRWQGPSEAGAVAPAAAPAPAAAQQCAYWGSFSSFLASWSLLLSPSAAQWRLQAARADSPLARQQGAELSAAAAEEAQSLLPFLLSQGMIHCVEVRPAATLCLSSLLLASVPPARCGSAWGGVHCHSLHLPTPAGNRYGASWHLAP